METQIKVENWQQLIDRMSYLTEEVRGRVIMDGLIAGANLINNTARATLEANKRGASKTGYNYLQTIWKYEQLKGKDPNIAGIRTGVWSRENGYKLRWLEWGTDDRYTHKRYNPLWSKIIPEMYRGRIEGSGYFFNAVRNKDEEVFRVMSQAVMESLKKIWKK